MTIFFADTEPRGPAKGFGWQIPQVGSGIAPSPLKCNRIPHRLHRLTWPDFTIGFVVKCSVNAYINTHKSAKIGVKVDNFFIVQNGVLLVHTTGPVRGSLRNHILTGDITKCNLLI